MRQRMMRLPRPEYVPPYSGVVIDSEDLLWVSFSSPGDVGTHLGVFDEWGRAVAEVALQLNIVFTDIGHDYILGLHQDDVGVHVVAFELARRS